MTLMGDMSSKIGNNQRKYMSSDIGWDIRCFNKTWNKKVEACVTLAGMRCEVRLGTTRESRRHVSDINGV